MTASNTSASDRAAAGIGAGRRGRHGDDGAAVGRAGIIGAASPVRARSSGSALVKNGTSGRGLGSRGSRKGVDSRTSAANGRRILSHAIDARILPARLAIRSSCPMQACAKMSVSGQPARSSFARVGRKSKQACARSRATLAVQHPVELGAQAVQVEHVRGGIVELRLGQVSARPSRSIAAVSRCRRRAVPASAP